MLRPLPFVLSCALAASAPALAAESTLLPEVWIYLEAGRYQPTEVDQGWAGWIGGSRLAIASAMMAMGLVLVVAAIALGG